jgi:hypothetical protein
MTDSVPLTEYFAHLNHREFVVDTMATAFFSVENLENNVIAPVEMRLTKGTGRSPKPSSQVIQLARDFNLFNTLFDVAETAPSNYSDLELDFLNSRARKTLLRLHRSALSKAALYKDFDVQDYERKRKIMTRPTFVNGGRTSKETTREASYVLGFNRYKNIDTNPIIRR